MLIDGKIIAQSVYAEVAARVLRLPFKPVFCDVLIGDHPASVQYVQMKAKKAEQLGFAFLEARFPSSASELEIVTRMQDICRIPEVAGLIVQLPVPAGFHKPVLVNAINPELDVDCLTEYNTELFYSGRLSFVPPTPAAVLAVLDSVLLPDAARSMRCVVVGQGELVGRPVAHLLRARGMQVTVITRDTPSPEQVAVQADVLITAAGQPGLVTASWVKHGAFVIDAGTAESGGSLVGDVDLLTVQERAGYVTPTPGGIGPVTVAQLFWNVLQVAEAKSLKRD